MSNQAIAEVVPAISIDKAKHVPLLNETLYDLIKSVK